MKILVRGANWIGDAVMTIPALRKLRRIFPEAEITLHSRAWAEGIFRDADFIDRILTVDSSSRSPAAIFRQSAALKKENFDLSILFPNSFESALISRLSKIPRRFGYAKEGRSMLLSDPVPIPDWKNEKHEIFYHLHLIAAVEAAFFAKSLSANADPDFRLNISDDRKHKIFRILKDNGIDPTRPFAVLVPGSTNSRAKRWGAENFAALSDLLYDHLGAATVLIGAEEELAVSNEVYAAAQNKPLILTGKTALSETAALLSIAAIVISNDTGPAHIASATGSPTLVIFGPTNPETTLPWSSTLIRVDVECSPCMLRDCPIDHRCMTRISPEMVFEKVLLML